METLLNPALAFVRVIDWQSPIAYLGLAMLWLAIIGRWGTLLLIIATILLGSVAHDFIVMNIRTLQEVIGVPMVIYLIGGVLVGISTIIAFIRYMIT